MAFVEAANGCERPGDSGGVTTGTILGEDGGDESIAYDQVREDDREEGGEEVDIKASSRDVTDMGWWRDAGRRKKKKGEKHTSVAESL